MNFITVDPNLMRHPKTVALAAELSVRVREAMSIVISLWSYAFQSAPGGDVTDLRSRSKLACAALDLPDADSALAAFDAMQEVGFLDVENGRTVIHDWADGAGRLEAKRARDAERQRSHRVTRSSQPVTVTPRDVTQCHALEEKREEENRREFLGANAPLSADADEPSGNSGEMKPKKANGKITPSEFETAVMDLYNRHCGDVLTRVRALDSKRRRNIRDLAAAGHGLAEFAAAFRHAASQSFLRGRNDRKWVADFEFCTRPDKFSKLLEGHQWGMDSASQTRMPLADGEVWGG